MAGTRKRWLWSVGVCLFALLTYGGQGAQAAEYTDIEGHWARPAIERWSDSGVLKGYSDGRFGPNDPVTRAQLSEILYRIWGCGPREGHSFPDVAENVWYHDAVVTMNACGIALNQGKNMYPDETLTREEAFYMVAKAFNIGDDLDLKEDPATEQVSKRISDGGEVEPAFWSRINPMLNAGYLNGANGMLHPKDAVSRAEIITVIDNMFDMYISSAGEYTIHADQIALVTCPDVTLTYVPTKIYHEAKVYLMAQADHGVTFAQREGKGKEIILSIRGVSEDGVTWTEEGLEFIHVKDEGMHLSNPCWVADLSFAGGVGIACCPYLIETTEQFLAMEDAPGPAEPFANNKSRYFSLLADIELPENQPSLYVTWPVNPHLLGNGHTVTLRAKGGSELLGLDDIVPRMGYGLFDGWSGECRDLILEGSIDITLDENYPRKIVHIGGFTNELNGGGLYDCTSRMDIKVTYTGKKELQIGIGGLAGTAKAAELINCTVQGIVSLSIPSKNRETSPDVGGLVGICSVETSWTHPFPDEGKEPELIYTGGDPLLLQGCGSTAIVSVQGGWHSAAGGIVGLLSCPTAAESTIPEEALGRVENCWSTASVSASGASFQSDCGGIVGQIHGGTVQNCWAKPAVEIGGGNIYKNIGGIVGCVGGTGKILNCWANAQGCQVPSGSKMDGHYGGITGRMWGEVSNCFVLGTEKFDSENAISYASWTSSPVTGCMDMTASTPEKREAFYGSCGWDFETVWDRSGTYPILRGCDAAAQWAAQEG